MILRLPGGGLATGIGSLTGSLTAERDEEAAELLRAGYMDGIRMRAAMRVRPVRAAQDAGEHHGAAVARLFLDVVDGYRSGAAAARMFLEVVEAARNGG